MSLRDEQLAGAQIVAQGTFKLDRRRAMEKMSRFQLEDPHRYVLELVAAAVRGGASEIHVRNDSDDFEISWDGEAPTAEELDFLFDHVFNRGAEDRTRMLQHFAQGIFGALGLRPSWVRVERPGVRYDLTDPMDIQRKSCARTQGVFVHVRERFGWAVVREFVSPFHAEHERELLERFAWTCPVPLVVNGKNIARSHSPPELTDGWFPSDGHVSGLGSAAGAVELVRDGIIVHHEAMRVGQMRMVGVLVDDDLDLNASRSKVVRNKHWETVVARLVQTAVQAVQEGEDGDPDLRIAGLFLLQHHLRHASSLASRKLFIDGAGRRYSLRELRKAPTVYSYPPAVAPDPTLEAPHFQVASDPQWSCLRERVGDLKDGEGLLESRHWGRERRRQLEQIVTPLSFMPAAVAERRFSGQGAEGAIALGATGVLPKEERGSFRAGPSTIELRVDGLPVQRVITNRLPEGMSARVEHPKLRADARFERVVQSPTYHRVLDLVVDEGHALLLAQAAERPRQTAVRKALIAWLHKLRPKGKWTRAKFESIPEDLRKAGLWASCGGEPQSLEDMSQGSAITTIRGANLMPDLVLIAPEELVLVRRLLPRSAVQDRTQDVENALVRATRLAEKKKKPKILTYCNHKLAVDQEGLSGEIGLADHEMNCRGTVLHEGISLGEHELALLPGVLVSVEWADALPDARMEGLEDLTQLEALADQLRPLVFELIKKAASERHPDLPFPSWLAGALRRGLVDDIALFVSSEGTRLSLSQLAPPVNVSSTALDHSWPQVQPLLIVDTLRLRALRDRLGVGAVNDLSHKVEERVRAHETFLLRPATPFGVPNTWSGRSAAVPGGLLEAEPFEVVTAEGTIRGLVGLSVDVNLKGTRIAFLLDERVLSTIALPSVVPAEAVVRNEHDEAPRAQHPHAEAAHPSTTGPIQPNNNWNGVLNQELLNSVKAQTLEAVQRLVDRVAQAETTPKPPLTVSRMVLTTLSADHPLAQRPLFHCMDGPMISLQQILEAETVYTVPSDLAAGVRPPEGKDVWIRLGSGVRHVLDAHVEVTSDGAQTLERLRDGMARRASMHREGLADRGDYAATLTHSEGSTHLWVGLSDNPGNAWLPSVPGKTPTGTGASLAWIIEERAVMTEERPDLAVPGVYRVTDDELEANDAFDTPRDGPARDRCLALVEQFSQAIGPLAGQALQQGGAQASLSTRWGVNSESIKRGLTGKLPLWGETASRDSLSKVRVYDPGALRRILVRSLTHEAALDEAWRGVGLVWTSDGRTLDAFELDQVARKGPLRIVPVGTVGRTLDPERPAIVANLQMRTALHGYRATEDYSEQLTRDEVVHERRERPAKKAVPDPKAILVKELPEPWRGHLEVHNDGRTGLHLYVAWRAVQSRSHDGCVPMVVHLDADFVPDADWRRVEADALLAKALDEMKALSDGLLEELVELDPEGQHHPGLWHRVIPRAFKHRREIKPSHSLRGRIAQMPIFHTGAKATLTPAQVVKLRKPVWIPWALSVPSGQKGRPFLILKTTLGETLKFWGGIDGTEVAKARKEALARRHAGRKPWRLPSRTRWLAEREVDTPKLKALVALKPELPVLSQLEVRAGGVPVQTWTATRWPGLAGVIDVSEERVDEDFRSVKRTRATDQALDSLYAELVKEAAPLVRDSILVRRRLITLLKKLGHTSKARAAWFAAELLEGPSNASLDQASAGTVIWGTVSASALGDKRPVETQASEEKDDRHLLVVLYPDPVTRELLSSLQIDHLEEHAWLRAQRRVVKNTKALEAAKLHGRQKKALLPVLKSRLAGLTNGLENAKRLRQAVLANDRWLDPTSEHLKAALEDPSSKATWMLAWEQVDQELRTQNWNDAAELAVRVAEKVLNSP